MPDSSPQYSLVSASLFAPLFAHPNQDQESFRKSLRDTIIKAFHILGFKINKTKKAELILDALFHQFVSCHALSESFSFSAFLAHAQLKKNEVKALLIELLYGLYYGDVDLLSLPLQNPKQTVEFLLIQLIAEKVSQDTTRRLLLNLPPHLLLSCISFVKKRYREGSYCIFQALLSDSSIEEVLRKIVEGIQRDYFDVELLQKRLQNESPPLQNLLASLEYRQEEETLTFYTLFQALIPHLSQYPTRLFLGVKEMKVKGLWNPSMIGITREQAKTETERLTGIFDLYSAHNYSLQDFRDFVSLFGLYNYSNFFPEMTRETDHLVEKIEILHKIFSDPLHFLNLSFNELNRLYEFVFILLKHLETTCRTPIMYKKGIDLLSFGICTSSKELAKFPGLPSLLQSLQALIEFLKIKVKEPIALHDFPVFVFDQSTPQIFAQNRAFIAQLNSTYKSAIIHISQKEALTLAKKIDIAPLLDTSQTGSFGFGGARNCLFLLTAPLTRAYKMGKKSIDELLRTPQKELKLLFQKCVLGVSEKSAGDTLFICDDDIEIGYPNLFSGALFAYDSQALYIECSGTQKGRDTKHLVPILDMQELLTFPEKAFTSCQWSDKTTSTDLAEHYCKPKICINIPHGAEERHLHIPAGRQYLLKHSYHLTGSRYPKKEIPTHSFVGLEEYLEKYLLYALLVHMSDSLIDPIGRFHRATLPWNDYVFTFSFKSVSMAPLQMFHNLREALSFMVDEKNRQALAQRFWANVSQLFKAKQPGGIHFFLAIQILIQLDIDATLQAFLEKESLYATEKASLQKIGTLYKTCQRDARIFWKFGEKITESLEKWNVGDYLGLRIEEIRGVLEQEFRVDFRDLPLTNGFYLMVQALGLDGFCKSLDQALGVRYA